MYIELTVVTSDGKEYYVEAEGYSEKDENDYDTKFTKITKLSIVNENDELVTNSIDKDIKDEIIDEIISCDFTDII